MAAVKVRPSEVAVEHGAKDTATLEVIAPDGRSLDRKVSWEIADSSVVSFAGTGSPRVIEGLSPGSTGVIATVDGVADTADVDVIPSVAEVIISPSRVGIEKEVDPDLRFRVALEDEFGNEVQDSVAWSSSNTMVVAVDGTGLVEAMEPGEATITATASNGESGSARVTVLESDWRTITDRPWDELEEDGWGQIVGKPVIEVDGTGPVSPGSVGASYFSRGGVNPARTPRAGINFYRNNETFGEVYVSMHVYTTSNFIGHESGTNKVFWVLDSGSGGGGDPLFLKWQGTDDGPLRVAWRIQNADDDVSNRQFRHDDGSNEVKLPASEAKIPRGEWVNVEFRLKINTGTNANGELHTWIDGVKVMQFTNVQFVGSASDHLFDELQWAPMWGGVGDAGPLPAKMGFKIDHLLVRIRS